MDLFITIKERSLLRRESGKLHELSIVFDSTFFLCVS